MVLLHQTIEIVHEAVSRVLGVFEVQAYVEKFESEVDSNSALSLRFKGGVLGNSSFMGNAPARCMWGMDAVRLTAQPSATFSRPPVTPCTGDTTSTTPAARWTFSAPASGCVGSKPTASTSTFHSAVTAAGTFAKSLRP